MRKLGSHGESKPELFNRLPSKIIIDILSRLPIRTIVFCKCVCRSWRDLLRTREFVDSHRSKSVPVLVISDGLYQSDSFRILEYDDEDRDVPYKLLTEIEALNPIRFSDPQASANGLLLLSRRLSADLNILYVCNPITREYIELPVDYRLNHWNKTLIYGFGVSRMSGQYKVVTILHEHDSLGDPFLSVRMSTCFVYTLGYDDVLKLYNNMTVMHHTPSFFSLASFVYQSVRRF